MQIETLKITDLKPHPGNPRIHPDNAIDRLTKSIKEYGWTNPILISEDNFILAGHARLKAAEKANLKKVPVIRLPLSGEKALSYMIADNKLQDMTEWDYPKLKDLLIELDTGAWDMELTGFDIDELKDLIDYEGKEDVDEGPEAQIDKAEELQKKWKVKLGQIWEIGRHRLMCGDSTERKDVEQLMDKKKAKLCFTSPPYADQREYGGCAEPKQLANFIKASNCDYYCVNLGLKRQEHEIVPYWDIYIENFKAAGYKLISWNVWDKGECGSIGNQSAMFGIRHEWIFVFGKQRYSLKKTTPNKSVGEKANHTGNRQKDGTIKKGWDGFVGKYRQMDSVHCISALKARHHGIEHPAMFPVELPIEYIKAFDFDVYDPFLGSGTTMVAAEQLNRICYGMEIEPKYVAVTLERMADMGLKPKKVTS